MPREDLQAASGDLREASEVTDDADAAATLADQADQFDRLATRDTGPDHGRLARHENALTEQTDALEGDALALVESALASIRSYRETIEGV
jgi:hypothetical protein